jgi:hypothetical protein
MSFKKLVLVMLLGILLLSTAADIGINQFYLQTNREGEISLVSLVHADSYYYSWEEHKWWNYSDSYQYSHRYHRNDRYRYRDYNYYDGPMYFNSGPHHRRWRSY